MWNVEDYNINYSEYKRMSTMSTDKLNSIEDTENA